MNFRVLKVSSRIFARCTYKLGSRLVSIPFTPLKEALAGLFRDNAILCIQV
jgi:hypothetical protein